MSDIEVKEFIERCKYFNENIDTIGNYQNFFKTVQDFIYKSSKLLYMYVILFPG